MVRKTILHKDTLQKKRLENYRQQIAKTSADPIFKADIDEIMEDFKFVDSEADRKKLLKC